VIGKTSDTAARSDGAGTVMVEARGIEKTFATGGALVHALKARAHPVFEIGPAP
jgi:hypothetical protein